MVASPPYDPAKSDSDNIARLWELFLTLEKNQNGVNASNDQTSVADREANSTAQAKLQGEISEVRSEFIVGLKKSAREDLWLAAGGAVLVALGDVLGAILAL